MNQKMRYVFNGSIKSSLKYLNYFKPDDQEVEDRLLALSDTAVCNRMELIPLIVLIKFSCYRSLSHLPRRLFSKLKLRKPRRLWTWFFKSLEIKDQDQSRTWTFWQDLWKSQRKYQRFALLILPNNWTWIVYTAGNALVWISMLLLTFVACFNCERNGNQTRTQCVPIVCNTCIIAASVP